MVLPHTYAATLIVMILGLLCLGSWANTFKLGGKWRFELYYFDFAFGVLLASILIAFTVGSSGFDGFSFLDDLMHAGKRQWFYGFLGGVLFNLANLLLLAAVSVAGLSVAFPLVVGTAIVGGSLISLVVGQDANSMLVLAGSLMILLAMGADGYGYSSLRILQHETLAKAGKAKSTRRPSSAKGIILSIVGGLLMGGFVPLLRMGMDGEFGLGPYSITFVVGLAVFFSTFVYNMFFVNLAVEGEAVEIGDYFKARPMLHLLGLAGGAIWITGTAATLVAGAALEGGNLGSGPNFGLSQGFAVIAALWGVLAWRELREGDVKVKLSAALMLLLFIFGLFLLSVAPVYVRKG